MNIATSLPQNLTSYSNEAVVDIYCHRFNAQKAEAKALFQQTLVFLWDCSRSGETMVPTKQIDEMWHVFILHTREYEQFCLERLGKFVHHYPRLEENACDATNKPKAIRIACDDGQGQKP
jgi:hypothetical protein